MVGPNEPAREAEGFLGEGPDVQELWSPSSGRNRLGIGALAASVTHDARGRDRADHGVRRQFLAAAADPAVAVHAGGVNIFGVSCRFRLDDAAFVEPI